VGGFFFFFFGGGGGGCFWGKGGGKNTKFLGRAGGVFWAARPPIIPGAFKKSRSPIKNCYGGLVGGTYFLYRGAFLQNICFFRGKMGGA